MVEFFISISTIFVKHENKFSKNLNLLHMTSSKDANLPWLNKLKNTNLPRVTQF